MWICNECGGEVKIQETLKQKKVFKTSVSGCKAFEYKELENKENDWAYECNCSIIGKGVGIEEIATWNESKEYSNFKLEKGMKILTNTLQEYIYTGTKDFNYLYVEPNEDKIEALNKHYVDWYETYKFNFNKE